MGSFQGEKKEAVDWIDENKSLLIEMSDHIWLYAEPPLQEYRASRLLAGKLKKVGFDVQLGVAGLDTAFIATYGEGKPVLSIYGEYGCKSRPLVKGRLLFQLFGPKVSGVRCQERSF